MPEIESFKKIDFVLEYIKSNEVVYKEYLVKEMYSYGLTRIEVGRIIDKLKRDVYIIESINYLGIFYAATFDSFMFLGYEKEYIFKLSENNRLGKLETAQMENQEKMTWLTTLVAVGTLIAAIYYLIEIIKCPRPDFSCLKFWP